MTTTTSPVFPAGIVLTTKGAERALRRAFGPDRVAVRRATVAFVLRHTNADFGQVGPIQAEENRAAIWQGGPILSRYTLPATGNSPPYVLTIATDQWREYTTVSGEDGVSLRTGER